MAKEFGLHLDVIMKCLRDLPSKDIPLAIHFDHAVALYNKAPAEEREVFALQALEFCRNFEQFESWARTFQANASPNLIREYMVAFSHMASEKLKMANHFEEVFNVWIKLHHAFLAETYLNAIKEMERLVLTIRLVEVIQILSRTDGLISIYCEQSPFLCILYASIHASKPGEIMVALKHIQSWDWGSREEEYPPVKLMMRKVSLEYFKR